MRASQRPVAAALTTTRPASARTGLPEGGQGEAGESVAEGELLGAGVEHEAGDEAVAEPPVESAQAAEVVGADRFAGLDLDAHDVARVVLEDGIHLVAVPVPVVGELRWLAGPGELAGNLADGEVLQDRTDVRQRVGAPGQRHPGEMAGDAAVGEQQ